MKEITHLEGQVLRRRQLEEGVCSKISQQGMMMKFLGLMVQMRVRRGGGQAEGWWMDGRW